MLVDGLPAVIVGFLQCKHEEQDDVLQLATVANLPDPTFLDRLAKGGVGKGCVGTPLLIQKLIIFHR